MINPVGISAGQGVWQSSREEPFRLRFRMTANVVSGRAGRIKEIRSRNQLGWLCSTQGLVITSSSSSSGLLTWSPGKGSISLDKIMFLISLTLN